MGKHRGPRKPQAEATYTIGYCRPPEHSRFKKGKGSPNPKGRTPKNGSLHAELDDELARTIEVREGGRVRKVTKRRAIAINLSNKAVLGDTKACVTVFNQVRREDLGHDDGQGLDEPLTGNDEALLTDYFRRRQEEDRFLLEGDQIESGLNEAGKSGEDSHPTADTPNQPRRK